MPTAMRRCADNKKPLLVFSKIPRSGEGKEVAVKKVTPLRRTRQGHDENDDDVVFGQMGHRPPLIPEAEYSAGFLRVEHGHVMNRERWFLYFRVVTPGDCIGTELYYSCPCPLRGQAFGLSSKLVAAATVALGEVPKRRDRLSSAMFKGKQFRVRVRTVKRDRDGTLRPPGDWYSVIDKLIAWEAGATIEGTTRTGR